MKSEFNLNEKVKLNPKKGSFLEKIGDTLYGEIIEINEGVYKVKISTNNDNDTIIIDGLFDKEIEKITK